MPTQLTDITNFMGFTNTKAKEPEPADNLKFDPEKLGEKKTLHKWQAPLRTPLKAFGGKLSKNLIIIGVVVALFLLLIGEIPIILVFASIIFIGYVLAATPPETVEYELTTHGIKYIDRFYYWNELGAFFFTEKPTEGAKYIILNIQIKDSVPARLFITVLPEDKEKVKEICNRYLPFLKEPPETALDKAYKKVTAKLDL